RRSPPGLVLDLSRCDAAPTLGHRPEARSPPAFAEDRAAHVYRARGRDDRTSELDVACGREIDGPEDRLVSQREIECPVLEDGRRQPGRDRTIVDPDRTGAGLE